MGGVAGGEDAAEFLIAGATAVGVGTATFWDPASPLRVANELGQFLRQEKIASVRDLIGTLRLHRRGPLPAPGESTELEHLVAFAGHMARTLHRAELIEEASATEPS